jgi:hypothetical protein
VTVNGEFARVATAVRDGKWRGIGSGGERDVALADRSDDGVGLDLEKAIRTLGVSRVLSLARTWTKRRRRPSCNDLKIMLQTVATVGRRQGAF